MVSRSYKYILLSTLILGTSFGVNNVFATDPEVDFSVTINPSLSLSVSSNTVNLPITPDVDGEYNTTNFIITSATNNMYGYTLTMSTEDNHTYLESTTVDPTTGTKPQIQSLASSQNGITAATFEAATTEANGLNRWGIAIGSGNYNAVTSPMQAKKTTANNASGADNTTVNIAAKLNLAIPAGTYKNKFIIQMVANPVPGTLEAAYSDANKVKATIGDKQLYAMQDMTPSICSNVTAIGDVIEVYDTRDNTIYHIGKLADERCWLLDNLALDLIAQGASERITASNTNADATSLNALFGIATRDVSTDPDGNLATTGVTNWDASHSFSVPQVNMTSKNVEPTFDSLWDKDEPLASEVRAGHWKVGGYYNYCAASAGSYCYGDGTDAGSFDVDDIFEYQDICPSGWRLPEAKYYYDFRELAFVIAGSSYIDSEPYYSDFRKALHLPLSGVFYDGSANDQGTSGFFWTSSSESSSTTNMVDIFADTSPLVYVENNNSRMYSGSVRCVAKTSLEY